MSTAFNVQDRLLASVRDFENKIGAKLNLPLNIDSNLAGPPAWIDPDGIWIREDIAEEDPDNLKVYLAHEVGHPLFANPALDANYHPMLVNYAQDYQINSFILKNFGYDVRKVKVPGIFSKRLGSMRYEDCLKATTKKLKGGNLHGMVCNCSGVVHSGIAAAVDAIRRKFPELSRRSIVIMDMKDREDFQRAADHIRGRLVLPEIKADPSVVAEGVWSILTQEVPMANLITADHLTLEESLVFAFNPTRLRRAINGDASKAAVAVAHFFGNIAADDLLYLRERGSRTETIGKTQWALKNRQLASDKRVELTARLNRAKAALAVLNSKGNGPIAKIQDTRTFVRKTPPPAKMHTLKEQMAPEEFHSLVGFTHNFLTKRIRKASCRNAASFEEFSNAIEEYERYAGTLPEQTTVSGNGSGQSGAGDGSNPPAEGPVEGEGGGDGQGEDVGGGAGRGTGSGSGTEYEGQGASGTRLSPTGPPTKLTVIKKTVVLHDVSRKVGPLLQVLRAADDFDSKLSPKPRTLPEDSNEPHSTYSFSNDVESALQSDLGLLGSDDAATRLLFYAKFAQHSLMTTAPPSPRRAPIILCVDGSGSMGGRPYREACGFALSVARKMEGEKRGFALVLFSNQVDAVYVQRPDKPLNSLHLLSILSSPAFGGTTVTSSLLEAFRIIKDQHWKKSEIVVVSDMAIETINATLINSLRTEERITGLQVGGYAGSDGNKSVFDRLLKVKRGHLFDGLLEIGNALI